MVIVVMGVSGSGKTTVGSQLAQQLGWPFADADDYHSSGNVEKMRSGIPLTDTDRAQWLHTLRSLISGWIAAQQNAVLACSALKQTYREYLRVDEQVRRESLRCLRRDELVTLERLDDVAIGNALDRVDNRDPSGGGAVLLRRSEHLAKELR